MRSLALLALTGTIAGCSAVAPPVARSPQAQAELQQQLAGRVAGAPVACIQPYQSREMIAVDDNTVLFKRGNMIYRNDPPGGCNGLGSGFYTLVTRSSGSGLCRGEIATVADLSTGMTVGSCSLGEFVPYTRVSG